MTRLHDIATLAVRISVAGFLITAVNVAPTVAQTCVAPLPGLIGWWDGDDVSGTTAFDLANGNDGTLTNGATTASGKVGSAFSFDGIDDVVKLAQTYKFSRGDDFTLDLWVSQHQLATDNSLVIDTRAGTRFGYDLVIRPDGTVVFGGRCDNSDNNWFSRSSPNKISPDDQWHHIAAVIDWTNDENRLYIDGNLEDIGDLTTCDGLTGSDKFLIGAIGGPFPDFIFNGRIDEVELFDRAVSETEIQAIFNADSAGICKSDTLDFFCDVVLNESVLTDGDQIIANVARLTNLGRKVNVEVKAWFDFDGLGLESHTNIGGDGTFWLAPGFDIDLGPINLRTVNAEDPRGVHEFNCRLLDPVSGDHLQTDINEFLIE